MKTIEVEITEDSYKMIENFANLRKIPVEKAVAALLEKFAPITHTMIEEELKKGYEESASVNVDWANL